VAAAEPNQPLIYLESGGSTEFASGVRVGCAADGVAFVEVVGERAVTVNNGPVRSVPGAPAVRQLNTGDEINVDGAQLFLFQDLRQSVPGPTARRAAAEPPRTTSLSRAPSQGPPTPPAQPQLLRNTSFVQLADAASSSEAEPPSINDYEIIEVLGSGSFAVVKKVVHKPTGVQYAMKALRRPAPASPRLASPHPRTSAPLVPGTDGRRRACR
jgi:hypothetical protein